MILIAQIINLSNLVNTMNLFLRKILFLTKSDDPLIPAKRLIRINYSDHHLLYGFHRGLENIQVGQHGFSLVRRDLKQNLVMDII